MASSGAAVGVLVPRQPAAGVLSLRSLQRACRQGQPLPLVVPRCAQLHGLAIHLSWAHSMQIGYPRSRCCLGSRSAELSRHSMLRNGLQAGRSLLQLSGHCSRLRRICRLTPDARCMPAGERAAEIGFHDAVTQRCCQAAPARSGSQVHHGECHGEAMLSAILQALYAV